MYDVDIESSQKLRYIHKVNGKTGVYFFANIGEKDADAAVRLRGKFTPEAWDPHTGQFFLPEFANVTEDDQPVTKVKLTLGRVHSLCIIANGQ